MTVPDVCACKPLPGEVLELNKDGRFVCPQCGRDRLKRPVVEYPVELYCNSTDDLTMENPELNTAPKNNPQEAKARASLLPMDLLMEYLVPAYEEGIQKYERESWRKGFATSTMIDAALRHIEAFYWRGRTSIRTRPWVSTTCPGLFSRSFPSCTH